MKFKIFIFACLLGEGQAFFVPPDGETKCPTKSEGGCGGAECCARFELSGLPSEACMAKGKAQQLLQTGEGETYIYCPDEPCPKYEKHFPLKNRCSSDPCGERQKQTEQGGCEACPDWTRQADDAVPARVGQGFGRQCKADLCPEEQVLIKDHPKTGGSCTGCGSYEYADPNSKLTGSEVVAHPSIGLSGTTCKLRQCGLRQKVSKKGLCVDCKDWERMQDPDKADRRGKKCGPDPCGTDEIIVQKGTAGGTCKKCTGRTHPDTLQHECVAGKCKGNQYLDEKGWCRPCADYSRADISGGLPAITCVPGGCGGLERVTKNGLCEPCPSGQKQSANGRNCEPANCGDRAKLTNLGACEPCPEYERAAPDGLSCRPDGCTTMQILLPDGTCDRCPDYTKPRKNKRSCGPDQCTRGRQKLLVSGSCQDCPDYERVLDPDVDNKSCAPADCGDRSVVLQDGTCNPCDDYTRAAASGRTCVAGQCGRRQKLTIKGTCEDCPTGYKAANKGKSCEPMNCKENERIAEDICVACPTYTRPTPDKFSCVADPCTGRQRLEVDGRCADCDPYTRPTQGRKVCRPEDCNVRQILQYDGTCKACDEYTRPIDDPNGQTPAQPTVCYKPDCEEREKRTPAGQCVACQMYTRAQSPTTCGPDLCGPREKLLDVGTCEACRVYQRVLTGGKECGETCTAGQIIEENGECTTCAVYSRPSVDRHRCQTDSCNDRQKLIKDGTCIYCPAYQRREGSNLYNCSKDQCVGNQKLLMTGRCQPCDPYTRVLSNKVECGPDPCGYRQKLLEDGTCFDCPKWERAEPLHGTTCIASTCNSRQMLKEDGECKDCPIYTRPSPDGRSCIQDDCGTQQRLMEDGSCALCSPYERAQGAGYTCGPDQCLPREILNARGACQLCPRYQRRQTRGLLQECGPDKCGWDAKLVIAGSCKKCPEYERRRGADGAAYQTCGPDPCSATQALQKDGTCVNCAANKRATSDGKGCEPDQCSKRQRLLGNGRCEDCPEYTRPTSDSLGCEHAECGARDRLTEKGECEACAAYARPVGLGHECQEPECPGAREYLLEDGTCATCPPYQRRAVNKKSCKADTCGRREYQTIDGSCAACAYYLIGAGRACIAISCGPRERVTIDGSCKACEDYTKASSDGRTCESVRCGDNQYLTVEATCRNCPRYLVQGPQRRSCAMPDCGPRQMALSVGTCFRCGDWERGQKTLDGAEASYTQYSGKCVKSDGADSVAVQDKTGNGDFTKCQKACSDAKGCTAFEFYSSSNHASCYAGLRSSERTANACTCMLTKSDWNDNRAVKGAYVAGSEVAVCYVKNGPYNNDGEYYEALNGRCATKNAQGATLKARSQGSSSLERCQQECSWNEDCNAVEWDTSGSRAKCQHTITKRTTSGGTEVKTNVATQSKPGTTRLDAVCYLKKKQNTLCAADTCTPKIAGQPQSGTMEAVQEDGTCKLCPEYEKPSADGRSCIRPECNKRQKLNKDGTCEYCKPYERASAKLDCKADECRGSRPRLLVDGTCAECGEYSVVSANRRYCYEPACGARSKLLNTGICELCQEGARADPNNNKRCVAANCSSGYRLTPEGVCVECPQYTVPSGDRLSCTHQECNDRQKYMPNGSCEPCNAYERAQDDGQNCGPDKCNVAVKVELVQASWSAAAAATSGAKNAIDGDKSTFAAETAGGGAAGAFWRADFKDSVARSISKVMITADPTTAGAKVQVDETDCGSLPATIRSTKEEEVECVRPIVGTYIKILSTGNGKPLRLYEVTVWSTSRREVVGEDGRCVACPLYERPKIDGRTCAAVMCQTREYLTSTGWCALCPDYTRPLGDGRSCGAQSCTKLQQVTKQGTCADCPPRQRASPQDGGKTCVGCTNGARQRILDNGVCVDCPKYTRPETDPAKPSACMHDTCSVTRAKLLPDGRCQDCPIGHRPIGDGIECAPVKCETGQIQEDDGSCRTCGAYSKPAPDRRSCTSDCLPGYRIKQDGSCEICPPPSRPDGTGRACVQPTCRAGERRSVNGGCEACPKYTRLQLDLQCRADECSSTKHYTTEQGECVPCPNGGNAAADGRSCDVPATGCPEYSKLLAGGTCGDECNGLLKLLPSGECAECMSWSRPSPDRRECISDTCTPDQQKLRDGTCQGCPKGQRLDSITKDCVAVDCGERARILDNGACEPCPEYTRAKLDGMMCQGDFCSQTEQLTTEGNCIACPRYQRAVQPDGKSCAEATCKADERLLKDGTCRRCPAYTRKIDSYQCDADACQGNAIILADGTCEPCPAFRKPNPMGRACIEITCDPGLKLSAGGICEQCPAYTRYGALSGAAPRPQLSPEASTHYILMLDRSGSMGGLEAGSKWTELVKAVREFFGQLATAQRTAKVSVIGYDDISEILFKEQVPKEALGDQIDWTGYGTNFEQPLLQAYQIATESADRFEEVLLYFLSDGSASYPATAVNNFLSDSRLKAKLGFVAVGFGDTEFPVLQQMADGIGGTFVAAHTYSDLELGFEELTKRRSAGSSGSASPTSAGAIERARMDCRPDNCSPRQRLLIDGTCQPCPDYTRAYGTPIADRCEPARCSANQYLMVSGSCATCAPYSRANADGKTCSPDSCGNQQYLARDGTCKYCAAFEVAAPGGKSCEAARCGLTQYAESDGTCKPCPRCTRAQSDGRSCAADGCNFRQIVLKNGTCKTCEDYTKPSGGVTAQSCGSCSAPTCMSYEVLQMDGTCRQCEKYQQVKGKACVDAQCLNPRTEIVLIDGTCEVCPAFSRPQSLYQCGPDTCTQSEYLLESGYCKACPRNERAAAGGRTCEPIPCMDNEIRQSDGTCKQCPPYTTLSPDRQECRPGSCDTNTSILQEDGSCMDCPDYMKPMRMGSPQPAARIHYILVLDRSGSMGGDKPGSEWTILVQSAQAFLDELASDPALSGAVRISAVAYSDLSDKIFHELEPSRQLMDRVVFTGGGTDFEKPLQHALEYILDAQGTYQFNEIFFFTDGVADYPQNAMSEFLRNPAIAAATKLTAVGYGDGDFYDLERMAEAFKNGAGGGIFRQVERAADLRSAFHDSIQHLKTHVYTSTNAGQWYCGKVACGPGQKVTKPGICEPCPQFTAPVAPNFYECARPNCDAMSILLESGVCKPCPDLHTVQGGVCVPITCPSDKRLQSDGQCVYCPKYSYPSADQRYCEKDSCDYTYQYLLESGKCANCDQYLIPAPDGRSCVPPSCSGNEIVTEKGKCKPCQGLTKVSSDRRSCEAITCQPKEVVQNNACFACQAYTYPNAARDQCISETCQYRNYLLATGRCAPCPEYQVTKRDNRGCEEPACLSTQFVNAQGECKYCQPRYKASADRRNCEPIVCSGRSIYQGQGCYDCPRYTYASADRTQCTADPCSPTQQLTVDGRCAQCPPYTLPTPDQKSCRAPVCASAAQRITAEGVCVYCPARTQVTPDRRNCEKIVCSPAREILQGNSCQACPLYTYPNPAQTSCISETCNRADRQVLQQSGRCQVCPYYTYPQRGARRTGAAEVTVPHHFILLLDRSGSMDGEINQMQASRHTTVHNPNGQWAQLLEAVRAFIQRLAEDPRLARSIRLSCIGYDDLSAVLFENEVPSLSLVDKITYTGGSTNFEKPLQDAFGIMRRWPQLEKFNLLFVSDGSASFPSAILQQIRQDQATWDKVEIDTLGFGKKNANFDALKRISQFFGPEKGEFAKVTTGQELKERLLKTLDDTIKKIDDLNYYYECKGDDCNARQRLLETGKCEDCQPYHRAQQNGRICGPDNCFGVGSGFIKQDGTCGTCEAYQRYDQAQKGCITPTCFGQQILQVDGSCVDCALYRYPAADKRSCKVDTCDALQYLKTDGRCEKCPAYTRPQGDGKQCGPNPCYAGQIVKEDGTCESCPEFQRASPNKRECLVAQCSNAEIVLSTGGCSRCPDYSRRAPDGKTCTSDYCQPNQVLQLDGTCRTCGQFQAPGQDGRTCVRRSCDVGMVLTSSGQCIRCNQYERLAADGQSCYRPTCGPREALQTDGVCRPCGQFERAQAAGTSCGPDTCQDPRRYIITLLGQCSQCPGGQVTSNMRTCQSVSCAWNEIRDVNGCRECAPYSRPINGVCSADACEPTQRLLQDGRCEQCALYSRAQGDGRQCGPNACNANTEILLQDGTCQYCPMYTRPQDGGKTCRADPCGPSEITSADGRCQRCPSGQTRRDPYTCDAVRCGPDQVLTPQGCDYCEPYQRPMNGICQRPVCDWSRQIVTGAGECYTCLGAAKPSPDGSQCVEQISCGPRQRWQNQACVDCPRYTKAQANYSRCEADPCAGRQRILGDGTCQLCNNYQLPTAGKKDCGSPRCASGQLITMEAVCVTVCPGGQVPDTARRRYCTIGGIRTAASGGLSRAELELEDHEHEVVGAAREEVDFLNEDEAEEFFQQEKQLLSLLQNP